MIDLKQTFECGQCFRWNENEDGAYVGIAMGKIWKIDNTFSELEIPKELRDYLDLDTDYESIQKELIKNDKTGAMEKAIEYGKGIHILRQDLWETIVDFIISQNNNIPRIKGCIEKLSECFGEEIGELDKKKYYDIPSPRKLASLTREDLAPVRLGYRDKFLIETAKMYETGERDISKFPGVGPKVESCIRLFGMHDMSSFPIDVWVKRVMNQIYGFNQNDVKGMQNFAKTVFGKYSGLAQQYLFNYIRNVNKG